MFKNHYKSNASVKIIILTVLFALYILYIAFPFLNANQPPDESTSKWVYDYAPVHYAMIYFPAFALYVYAILKNILNVKKIRWLIYPIVFITLFIAIHLLFFVYSMVILWFCLITIPVGFITFLAIESLAICLDIKEQQSFEKDVNKNENIQRGLNIIGGIVIPICLIYFLLYLHSDITTITPQKAMILEQQRQLQCKKDKKVIKTAINNINININNASYEEISNKFQKEFSKKNIYEPLLGEKYDKIDATTDKYFSKFKFSKKLRNGTMSEFSYEFHKKSKDNKTAFWETEACKVLINENGLIIND